MYCPRCGSERVSDATSFCSKCGLLLDHIEEVMENGGEAVFTAAPKGCGRWLNQRNVRISALFWFVVVTILLTPFAAIMNGPTEMIATFGLLGPVGAALLLIASMFFPSAAPSVIGKNQGNIGGQAAGRRELPPDRTEFARDFTEPGQPQVSIPKREVGTAPPSVTEETTRHLDRKLDDDE